MPNVRRSNRTFNRKPRTTRRILRGKPTKTKNKSAILTLTRKVNQLQRVQKRRTATLMYGMADSKPLSTVSAGYIQQPLMNFYGSPADPAWEGR